MRTEIKRKKRGTQNGETKGKKDKKDLERNHKQIVLESTKMKKENEKRREQKLKKNKRHSEKDLL